MTEHSYHPLPTARHLVAPDSLAHWALPTVLIVLGDVNHGVGGMEEAEVSFKSLAGPDSLRLLRRLLCVV